MSNKLINPENFKEWIQKIEYNPDLKQWEGRFFPNYIFTTHSFRSLMELMQKAVCHEVACIVCDCLNVPISHFYVRSNHREKADAKAITSFICRNKFNMTTQAVADVLKYGNHSSVISNAKKMKIREVQDKLSRVQSRYDILKF